MGSSLIAADVETQDKGSTNINLIVRVIKGMGEDTPDIAVLLDESARFRGLTAMGEVSVAESKHGAINASQFLRLFGANEASRNYFFCVWPRLMTMRCWPISPLF